MKILNLYSCIGGNRKLWGNNHEITAVEINPQIAAVYCDFFPDDKMIVGDAHEYLLNHYQEFDFVWSSPPCPTHARLRYQLGVKATGKVGAVYPDMTLYQEIIFLMHHCENIKWVVENVVPYYRPLIPAKKLHNHLFWSNFVIPNIQLKPAGNEHGTMRSRQDYLGMDISGYQLDSIRKDKLLRNCINPELGVHILKSAYPNSVQSVNPFHQAALI